MKAWKIAPVSGGYTVDCIDGSTGAVRGHVGCDIVLGGMRVTVWTKAEAQALADQRNAFERENLLQQFDEYVQQINQPTPALVERDDSAPDFD